MVTNKPQSKRAQPLLSERNNKNCGEEIKVENRGMRAPSYPTCAKNLGLRRMSCSIAKAHFNALFFFVQKVSLLEGL